VAEPALREHVIEALKQKEGRTVTDLGNGDYEVADGSDIRVIHLDATVPRNFLSKLERWYKIPTAAWYPPASFRVPSDTKDTGS
jgi:hypothetical protein